MLDIITWKRFPVKSQKKYQLVYVINKNHMVYKVESTKLQHSYYNIPLSADFFQMFTGRIRSYPGGRIWMRFPELEEKGSVVPTPHHHLIPTSLLQTPFFLLHLPHLSPISLTYHHPFPTFQILTKNLQNLHIKYI